MKPADQILYEHGIKLRSFRSGNQKTKCPKCSHLRRHKSDPCLSVSIKSDGVCFNCHNCGYHGGDYFESRPDKPDWRSGSSYTPSAQQGKRGYGALQHAAAGMWR